MWCSGGMKRLLTRAQNVRVRLFRRLIIDLFRHAVMANCGNTVLVTGGAGFLGSRVVHFLAESGLCQEIRILDLKTPGDLQLRDLSHK